jgi:hypothetical protein
MCRARAVPTLIWCLFVAGVACSSPPAQPAAGDSATHGGEATLWTELQRRCGEAYEGRVVEGTEPSDDAMRSERLVMHVRECGESEIRVPFHVGSNRSRTWVITRTADGLRLKHDHRHEDGTPDATTEYGGDSRGPIDLTVEFPADAYTGTLLPAAATNVWTLSIDPGRTFTYALRRENSPRRFRAAFDLTRTVETPPAPW